MCGLFLYKYIHYKLGEYIIIDITEIIYFLVFCFFFHLKLCTLSKEIKRSDLSLIVEVFELKINKFFRVVIGFIFFFTPTVCVLHYAILIDQQQQ